MRAGRAKAATKKDRQARELLAAIVDSCADAIASADLRGTIQTWNHACEVLHALPAMEAVGMNLREVVSPYFREEIGRNLAIVRTGGALEPFEYVVQHLDGSQTDLSVRMSAVRNKSGEMIGTSAVFRDITERKRTEECLRNSLDSLEHTQRIGVLGCYELDIRTLQWTSSAVMDEIFGINKDFERTIAGWTLLIHPSEREMINDYFRDQVLGKGEDFNIEYRIIRESDKAVRWVHGIGKLEFDTCGNPIKMRGAIRDITESKLALEQIRRNQKHYQTIFQTSIDAVLLTRLEDGLVLDVNQAFLEMTGSEREDVIGKSTSSLELWVDFFEREMLAALVRRDGKSRDYKAKFKRKNGEVFSGLLSVAAIEIDGIPFALSVLRDNSHAEAAAQKLAVAADALRLSEARYRTAFQTSLDAININRMHDYQYIDCNQAFLDATGFEREEVLGRTPAELGVWVSELDRTLLLENLRRKPVCKDFEAQFQRKNGQIFWGRISVSKIEVDGVPCLLTVSRDIDSERRAAEEIKRLAFYDQLTQIPNRQMLQESLLQSLSYSRRTARMGAMLMIDLDDFKTLNDSLGHRTGDLLLQEAAARLVACTAGSVARLGGDEFVVVLDGLSEAAEGAMELAKDAAQRIRASIAQPYQLAGRNCLITCSIGITTFGGEQDSIESILQQADIALYKSKAAGRNTVCSFAPALQLEVSARASMEENLRQAIGTKQFELYYQPQIDHDSIIGAEALLRWNSPNQGLISPGVFIPLAEETGLILPLGAWVMEAAFTQVAAWAKRTETERLSVAVNISARQFRQPEFVEQVLATLHRTGANPKRIKLELTESATVDNIEDLVDKMIELKSHGLSFSLDDFGTGYSSLSYLRKLPLDQLKIDRAFVRDMILDPGSGAIAQAIMSLSKALDLSVMAEGVETEVQRDFLLRLGCRCFQGYLFGRPLPLQEFEKLLVTSSNENAAGRKGPWSQSLPTGFEFQAMERA